MTSKKRTPLKLKHNKDYSNWKNTYRQICYDRFKETRAQCFQNGRSLQDDCDELPNINELMTQEWHIFKQTYEIEESSVDELTDLFEEIKKELQQEEGKILRQYEEQLGEHIDNEELNRTIDKDSEVVCPVCQRNPLLLNRGIIFCQCGLRIDTEQDCLDLEFVRLNLEQASTSHTETQCDGVATFLVTKDIGIQTLTMCCQKCDFMYVII